MLQFLSSSRQYCVSYVKWTGWKTKMEFYTSDSVINDLETNQFGCQPRNQLKPQLNFCMRVCEGLLQYGCTTTDLDLLQGIHRTFQIILHKEKYPYINLTFFHFCDKKHHGMSSFRFRCSLQSPEYCTQYLGRWQLPHKLYYL